MNDGAYRYLVKPNANSNLSGSYTDGGTKTWSFSPSSVSAGNYKVFQVDGAKVTEVIHTLTVGDFYMNDGSLLAGSTETLTEVQQAACIGIVYSTDVNRIGTAAQKVLEDKGVTPHGLVMALTNASERCRWGNENLDENSGGTTGEPFKDNTNQLAKQYNNVNGYAETHWIIDTYGKDGNTALQNTYSAFYHANRYGTAEGGTAQYAAPANTTDWFIPSMGQWWDILSNLGGINLDSYKTATNIDYAEIYGAGTTANNMNTYLNKISSATQVSLSDTFWSSSEGEGNGGYQRACHVNFLNIGYLQLHNNLKNGIDKVRCSFAF